MTGISRPFVTADDPDRHIRCEDALDAAFYDLLNQAVEAGWSERESIEAIVSIAQNHRASLAANDETDGLVALLKGMLNRTR